MAVDLKLYEKASSLIKREDMVKLLRELVNIKSPFFEEGEIIDYLRGRLSYYNRLQAEIPKQRCRPSYQGHQDRIIARLLQPPRRDQLSNHRTAEQYRHDR